ncbi:hypothetical protein H7J93_09000 [Mycobacterium barrassiae]|uniref:hypothetical protein n=1 Tax=Mycobacterium barrassiae TaxID=319709 RepID=UPI002265B8DC|nr:hypothetical protein [Mycobacterium barrassiae]MCV7299772.1 hypothetical protein [Mycobacterium barrassiae]
MLEEFAAWATIAALPLTAVGALIGVASIGRQRGLRQQLREVLDEVFKACDEYQQGNHVFLNERFLRSSAERLRLLSERDGLRSPSTFHMAQLRDILLDIAGRFDVPASLPTHGLSPQQREELLEANEQRLTAGVDEARRRSATYLRAVNKMDAWRYLTYLRFKRFGITSRTFANAASDDFSHPWTGPLR